MPVPVNRPPSRAQLLLGTDEPVPEMRRIACGPLSAMLFGGNLRYIKWGGLEIVRAISAVVRDTRWGTHPLEIAGLKVAETAKHFEVRYKARCGGEDGRFTFEAIIKGLAEGRLEFSMEGTSPDGFATNRAGFVVLHPLEGAAGRPLEVHHTSGGQTVIGFPEFIDPAVVATDIRTLVSSPAAGVELTLAFSGEAFEMEDHRNWCDASFKTYVRPLALGFPYRISPGEHVSQAVCIAVAGPPPPPAAPSREVGVKLRGNAGRPPAMGLFVERDQVERAGQFAHQLRALGPAYLLGRVDLRESDHAGQLATLAALCRDSETALALQAVISGLAPERELATLAQMLAEAPVPLDSLHVLSPHDFKNQRIAKPEAGQASAAEILAVARRLFPGIALAGGKPTPFVELNRDRPPTGFDLVVHATQATTHDADDISVMETLEALPFVIRSTRHLVGNIPYRIGPATIGRTAFAATAAPAANPQRRRMCNAADDPRQSGLFGAAFALGYASAAAAEGIDAVTLAAPTGPFGLYDGSPGPTRPMATVIAGLARLRDARLIETAVPSGVPLAALAAETAAGVELWLANLAAEPLTVIVDGDILSSAERLDAAVLASDHPGALARHEIVGGRVALDAYAVCRLTGNRGEGVSLDEVKEPEIARAATSTGVARPRIV